MADHQEKKPVKKNSAQQHQLKESVPVGRVQFQDNRQNNHSQLQAKANNSPMANKIAQLQGMATRYTNESPKRSTLPINMETDEIVQRMVWPIGRDETSESNYNKLVDIGDDLTDTTGSLRPHEKEDSPFDNLGLSESLHLVGHGDGKGHIEGMNASQLLDYLIGLGLTPKHTGAIRLVSCLSGTPRPRARLFTEQFKEVLEARGFVNGVIGFNGLVRVVKGASIEVVAPKNIPKFNEISPQLTTINNAIVRIVGTPPNYDPSTPEWQDWNNELVRLRTEAAKLSVQVIWDKQSLDTNISYFPPGINLQEQHQKDKLGGLTLIPGEEAKDVPVANASERTGVVEERNLNH